MMSEALMVPKTRESVESSRWSPMPKYWPGGTMISEPVGPGRVGCRS